MRRLVTSIALLEEWREFEAAGFEVKAFIHPRGTTMHKEFFEFLKKYGIIGLAIAVIIGGKLNALVTSVVDGILMPIVTFFIRDGDWRKATFDVGPVKFLLGPVLGASVDFLLVAFLVFMISKKILKEDAKKA
jgi:large conductance mechanosensitive channel